MELIDWEPALRHGNLWYDRLVAVLRLSDRGAREKALLGVSFAIDRDGGKAG
jgi:hypothetical protein